MQDMLKEILKSKLSTQHSGQVDLASLIRRKHDLIDTKAISKVLDLGCGGGRAYETLKSIFANMRYFGLDIEASPEVSQRERTDLAFYSYNGVDIPFEGESFDAIYCSQVLEHVRQPDQLVADAARVLRKKAWFLGSVSQLEPYHSHSIFNWTPYGIVQVFESHGLEVIELAPGIDGITLTLRRLFGFDKFRSFFANEGLFNHYIEQEMTRNKASIWERNYLKLVCAGHICFIARKQ